MNRKGLLKCDKCSGDVLIVDTRLLPETRNKELYRRRIYKCAECGIRFETLEKIKGKGIKSWQGPV